MQLEEQSNKHPEKCIEPIINLCNPAVLSKIYRIKSFSGYENFLEQVAIKRGRLLKAAQPDLRSIAISVIRDWQFGKIPDYVKSPEDMLNYAIEKTKKKMNDGQSAPKNENSIPEHATHQNTSEAIGVSETPERS